MPKSFIRAIVEAKSRLAEEQGKWLSERLETLQQQAFEAARKVNRFRSVGDSLSSQDALSKARGIGKYPSSYRKMYDDFQRQYNETLQRISYPDADVRIISRASAAAAQEQPAHFARSWIRGCSGGTERNGVCSGAFQWRSRRALPERS